MAILLKWEGLSSSGRRPYANTIRATARIVTHFVRWRQPAGKPAAHVDMRTLRPIRSRSRFCVRRPARDDGNVRRTTPRFQIGVVVIDRRSLLTLNFDRPLVQRGGYASTAALEEIKAIVRKF